MTSYSHSVSKGNQRHRALDRQPLLKRGVCSINIQNSCHSPSIYPWEKLLEKPSHTSCSEAFSHPPVRPPLRIVSNTLTCTSTTCCQVSSYAALLCGGRAPAAFGLCAAARCVRWSCPRPCACRGPRLRGRAQRCAARVFEAPIFENNWL